MGLAASRVLRGLERKGRGTRRAPARARGLADVRL